MKPYAVIRYTDELNVYQFQERARRDDPHWYAWVQKHEDFQYPEEHPFPHQDASIMWCNTEVEAMALMKHMSELYPQNMYIYVKSINGIMRPVAPAQIVKISEDGVLPL